MERVCHGHGFKARVGQRRNGSLSSSWPRPRRLGYVLEADEISIDVDKFEQFVNDGRRAEGYGDIEAAMRCFERAIALCRGDYLGQDTGDWIEEGRQWYRSQVLEALGALRRTAANRNDPAGTLGWSRRILQIDPYHEPSYRSLMELHGSRGERGQVKVWFELCRQRMDELGVEVDTRTQALYEQMVDGCVRNPEPVVAT